MCDESRGRGEPRHRGHVGSTSTGQQNVAPEESGGRSGYGGRHGCPTSDPRRSPGRARRRGDTAVCAGRAGSSAATPATATDARGIPATVTPNPRPGRTRLHLNLEIALSPSSGGQPVVGVRACAAGRRALSRSASLASQHQSSHLVNPWWPNRGLAYTGVMATRCVSESVGGRCAARSTGEYHPSFSQENCPAVTH
jgi:hypothetical protein